jgi:hypothetical protein
VTTELAVRDQGLAAGWRDLPCLWGVATRHRRRLRFLRAWLNSARRKWRAPPTGSPTRGFLSSAPRAMPATQGLRACSGAEGLLYLGGNYSGAGEAVFLAPVPEIEDVPSSVELGTSSAEASENATA